MAKSARDLKGWEYIIAEAKVAENDSPLKGVASGRRSSRRVKAANESLVLKREMDDLEIQAGDTVLVHQKGATSPEIAFIKEIKFGNDNFIDIVVSWFIRIQDIDFEDLPKAEEYSSKNDLIQNELFITMYLEGIFVSEIVEKVNVLSLDEFKDILIDDSNTSNTFMVRRGCSSTGEEFTNVLNYRELTNLFHKDPNEFVEYVRAETVRSAYNSPKKEKVDIKEKIEKIESKKKSRRRSPIVRDSSDSSNEEDISDDSGDEYKGLGEEVENEDGEDEEEDHDVDDDEDDKESVHLSDSEEEFAGGHRNRKRKSASPKKSTAKVKRAKARLSENTSISYMNSVLSPSKKQRFKIKSANISKPSLASLSPQKKKGKGTLIVEEMDKTSEAFREIKAKLHTSQIVTSLPGREDEFASIYTSLDEAIEHGTGCCLYISGTPGIGKTATVREVIAQLQESVKNEATKPFDYLEINGLKLLSPNVAYEVLWEKISGFKVTPANAAILLEKYFSTEEDRKPLVVLMDELDQIVTQKQNVMYNFFNWPSYATSKLIVIAVANTMDLPERVLSNKISSRLGLRRMEFKGYQFGQLGEIIAHRLAMLSEQSKRRVILTKDASNFASRKVSNVTGDARRALTICRRAVEIAEQEFLANRNTENSKPEEESFHILITHISKAINETINSPISKFLESLPFAYKLVLMAILLRMKRSGLGENSLGDVIDEMRISLQMFTSKESSQIIHQLGPNASLMNMLYSSDIFDFDNNNFNIRIHSFKRIVNELAENGIITQQNVPGERYRLVHLTVSEEEIISVLKRDKEISGMM
ncbi:origin recognition complex subunit 1 [Scheffersomyces xylosifermentans]|uniref:origin recognition complex subunit 1 n=1 Tax=Scheffersomyces xylosifermentans TaxID=1304137 RepID=UPI00315D97E3